MPFARPAKEETESHERTDCLFVKIRKARNATPSDRFRQSDFVPIEKIEQGRRKEDLQRHEEHNTDSKRVEGGDDGAVEAQWWFVETEETACHWDMWNHRVEMAQSVEKTDARGNREADPHPLVSEETGFRIRHHKRELNNRESKAFPL